MELEKVRSTVDVHVKNNTQSKFVFKEQSKTGIPIELYMPNQWLYNEPIHNLADAYNIATIELPAIEKLAKKAFLDREKDDWDNIQKLLYAWNIKDIFRKDITSDYRFVLQTILRNKVIEIEHHNRSKISLECKNSFTPEKAVQELADMAQAHRINTHPLLAELSSNGLALEHIKVFLNNYYVNNRLFHLFIATLSLFTPLEKRTELANNFHDELGSGDSAMAHPLLFLKNFNTIGKPTTITPLPEALYLVNSKLYAAFLSGNYHYGMGGFGCIELTMPNQMIKILDGLRKSGFSEQDVEFWRVHITIDVEHGKTWFREMKTLVTTPEEAECCLQGGMALLDARASMFDGIWNHIVLSKL